MKIPIVWHKEHRGNWDHSLLIDTFKDPRFADGAELSSVTDNSGKEHFLHEYGAIYVVSGEHASVKEVNEDIAKYKWVILIVTSDEQSKFPIEKIKHPKMKAWVMYPKQGRHDAYSKLPLGYTPHTRPNLQATEKYYDWFFAGQTTHERRRACVQQLESMKELSGKLLTTGGFAQGFPSEDYMDCINHAKTAPAPAGPVCADSFRLYEALEAGAVPIADGYSQAGDHDYFNYLFDNPPFPSLKYYHDLPGYIEDQVKECPAKNNRVQAWWQRYKKDLKQKLIDDAEVLSGNEYHQDITVVVPVSPIKSHPSTETLEKSIDSVRHHLKNAEIIITFDGVRPEQEDRREDYEEFIRQALFLCNTKWDATPVIFDDHTHQVGMLRAVVDTINTPTILYVEGDTGLVIDKEIDFEYMNKRIIDGESNLIRLHFESRIPDEHTHLMLNKRDQLIETIQWSQRPHLASTAYYKRILADYFSPDANSFIEDKMHSVVAVAHHQDGRQGWLQHRLHIYAPVEDIKYSVDFDGREGEAKYDQTQVF